MTKYLFVTLFLLQSVLQLSAQSPSTPTSSEILLQLKKLNTVGSVLYIAAHPDDENTRLLAWLANEKCVRTGYLSLTRGDGGQNLIGSEQGIELGMIRTQELLAARRIDGAEQFFTRAYDFGYSKSPKETFTKWEHDSILADVVWTIRLFRPDIIITRFATDGSGGHGHHTASAILAGEAFDAAADPNRFPEQLEYVQVWQARRLFYNNAARFWNPAADMNGNIKTDVGGFNPLLGKSYGEIAAESRSMHKSQGFGSAKQRGEIFEYFKPIKGDTANLISIFDRIDLSWNRYGAPSIKKMIEKAMHDFKVDQPEASVEDLQVILERIETSKALQMEEKVHKLAQAQRILLQLTGFIADPTISTPNICAGSKQKLQLNIVNRGQASVVLKQIQYNGHLNNALFPIDSSLNFELKTNIPKQFEMGSQTHLISEISQPYYLTKPIMHNMFVVDDRWKRNAPELGINNNISMELLINKKSTWLSSAFQYRWVDPEKGELYRPLVYTPPVMLNLNQKSVMFTNGVPKELTISVKAGRDSVIFDLEAQVPEGYTIFFQGNEPNLKGAAFVQHQFLQKRGEERTYTFKIQTKPNVAEGMVSFTAKVDGIVYDKGIREIKYDHIPVQTWFPDATAKLVPFQLNRKLQTIGYIEGAGDELIPALEQIGYHLIKITDDMLQNGDLSIYPTIITGVRAFNVNEKLQLHKQRLFDYVKQGGNLVVQYNTNSFAGPLKEQIAPIPFKIGRERVTDENAEVRFLLPNHPALNNPNTITSKDFEGWIQERGIYFGNEMDSSFVCPLSMNDPDEKPNKGSLAIAKVGKGNYIYTGLVFFRELPAGVAGAYRLFVNLIELEK